MSQEKRRAIIRYNIKGKHKGATVLCPIGHLLDFIPFDKSYAGSRSQMHLSYRHEGDIFDRMAETCEGAGH